MSMTYFTPSAQLIIAATAQCMDERLCCDFRHLPQITKDTISRGPFAAYCKVVTVDGENCLFYLTLYVELTCIGSLVEANFQEIRAFCPLNWAGNQELFEDGTKDCDTPSFTVIGMLYHGKNEHQEIPRLWEQFNLRSAEIESAINAEVCYGIADNF